MEFCGTNCCFRVVRHELRLRMNGMLVGLLWNVGSGDWMCVLRNEVLLVLLNVMGLNLLLV